MKLSNLKDGDKLKFTIIGLPRSGTTLMAKIMNSIDGVKCLSEPIRSMHSSNLKTKKRISITDLEIIDQGTDSFLSGYHKYIDNSPTINIGGVKETYSPVPSRINREVNKVIDKCDFIIFMLREPKANFSGWKQLKWNKSGILKPRFGYNVDMFVKIYEDYVTQYHETKMIKPTFLIRYEDLCENFSTNWMNRIFRGYLKFDGEFSKFDKLLGNGDSICINSDNINKPRTRFSNLDIDEVNIINDKLSKDYKDLRGYGYY